MWLKTHVNRLVNMDTVANVNYALTSEGLYEVRVIYDLPADEFGNVRYTVLMLCENKDAARDYMSRLSNLLGATDADAI